jgi:ankyrin repeat protein
MMISSSQSGNSAIMWASMLGQEEACRLLIALGANAAQQDQVNYWKLYISL